MVSRGLWLGAALSIAAVTPGFAAPAVKATVSHMCCGGCESAIKTKATSLGEVTTDRPGKSVTVMGKENMDVMASVNTLTMIGFPPTNLYVSGAKMVKMDVGHLCCGACVGPLTKALTDAGYKAEVKANQPVMLTVDENTDCIKVINVMRAAGFAPTTMVCMP
jgi:hypothetical protein